MEVTNIPSTYTLMAKKNDLIGVITQSKYLAIGSLVHFFYPNVGLIVVQGKPDENVAHSIKTMYLDGHSSVEAVKDVESKDEYSDYRQIGFLPLLGRGCCYTGEKLKLEKMEIEKTNCISMGNFLTNRSVIPSIIKEFEKSVKGEQFAIALLNGIKEGLKRGGEKRGQQSAAIKVWKKSGAEYSKVMDLRVDDSENAIEDLEKLVKKYYLYLNPVRQNDKAEHVDDLHEEIKKILKNASDTYKSFGESITLENLYRIENLENRWISEQLVDKDAFEFLKDKFLS